MNLLSHHACAAGLSRAAQLGSALPDLLPLHRRELRVLPLTRSWERGDGVTPEMAEVAAGVRFHLRVDSRFHRDPIFADLCGQIRKALLGAGGTPGLKRFFPAHILTEMYFDHLLMYRLPGLVDDFYALFDEPGISLAVEFTAIRPETDSAALRRFLERIAAERFLDDYRSLEGMVYRAQRMLALCRQRPLEPVEVEAVASTLPLCDPESTDRVLQFIGHMRDGETSPADPRAARAHCESRHDNEQGGRRTLTESLRDPQRVFHLRRNFLAGSL